jgi:hypothetical protein
MSSAGDGVQTVLYSLTIGERLLIETMLPWNGKWAEVALGERVRQKVRFDDEEKAVVGLQRLEDGGWAWKEEFDDAEYPVELTIPEDAFVKLRLDYVDMAGNVVPPMLSLYEKFLGHEGPQDPHGLEPGGVGRS